MSPMRKYQNQIPKFWRPKLAPSQCLDAKIIHWDLIDRFTSGSADKNDLWDWIETGYTYCKVIEARVEAVVLDRFGLPAKLPPEVKEADRLALAIEQRSLMPLHDDVWDCETHPGFIKIRNTYPEPMVVPIFPSAARKLFMARFWQLWPATYAVVPLAVKAKRPINCGTGHCSCIECHFDKYDPQDDGK